MMKMKFTFDKNLVAQHGYSLEKIYDYIKGRFSEKGFVCTSDNDVLAFAGTGTPNDYGRMLGMMMIFDEAEWFLNTASSWHFTTDESKGWEDVLVQSKSKRDKKMAVV